MSLVTLYRHLWIEYVVDHGAEAMANISDTLKWSKFKIAGLYISYMTGTSLGGAVFGLGMGIHIADRKLREDMQSRTRIVSALKRLRAEEFRKNAENIERTLSDSNSE